jgi:hypothetical protein
MKQSKSFLMRFRRNPEVVDDIYRRFHEKFWQGYSVEGHYGCDNPVLENGHPEASVLAVRVNLINVLLTERVAWVAHWLL